MPRDMVPNFPPFLTCYLGTYTFWSFVYMLSFRIQV